ncbi:MAG: alpha/beta fold hydrolase [Frankiaceae bacterium]
MSLRRKVFATVLLVAALAATVAVLVAGVFGSHSPTAKANRSIAPEKPGAVLLVPGYGGSVRSLEPLARRLRAAGRDVTVVTLPDGATGDLGAQARSVRSQAAAVLRRTAAPSLDVVGYSAGGVVVRLWLSQYGGREVVRRVVTLATPHHGTRLAEVAGALAPDLCPLACQQLSPNSELLGRLNRGDETPNGPTWLSAWSATDQVVTPPSSARLNGAVNVALQSVCADSAVQHGQLPADPLVIGLVRRSLGAAPITAPTARDCGALRRLGAT